jgi:hypothetical protein
MGTRMQPIRNAATTLALVAMLLRALLPDGWMPAPPGSHATLVICTATGFKHIALPGEPSKKQHENGNESGPCAFAAASPFAPPAALASPLPQQAERAAPLVFAQALPPSRAVSRANNPRAPPVFV